MFRSNLEPFTAIKFRIDTSTTWTNPHGGSGKQWGQTPEKNIQPLSYPRSSINVHTGYKRDERCTLDSSSRIARYKTSANEIPFKRDYAEENIRRCNGESDIPSPLCNCNEFSRKLVYRVRRWRDRTETKCLMLFDGKPDGWSSSPVQSINHLRTRRNFLFKIPKSLPLPVYISISLHPKKKTLYKHILTILLLLQSQIFYVYILCVTWRTKIPNKSKRETYTNHLW